MRFDFLKARIYICLQFKNQNKYISEPKLQIMHPSADMLGTKSSKLSGKKIVLAVTGSIAAVESVKLAHELIRHGAEVVPVMSGHACKILHPDALEFATGNKVITELTGAVEHVSLCGEVTDRADLLLIAPATANTISKIAQGIDETPVTTFATTALGTGIPVIIVPAMHGSMYANPFVRKNVELLTENEDAIELVAPRFEEHKAKIAETPEIVARVLRKLGGADLVGRSVLVVAGSTAEPVDDFRVAVEAFTRGAQVMLWYGASPAEPPTYILTERFQSTGDLLGKLNFIDNDITIVCAAISDYTPDKQEGKIPSGAPELELKLKPTPKVLGAIREANPQTFLVGFKAEYDTDDDTLVEKAQTRLEELGLNMIVANDLKSVQVESNNVIIINRDGTRVSSEGAKSKISEDIFDEIISRLAVE
jgi:phosphopantothenoylcysteine decarboxylase/phosphopantothenate--cysteine ligase